MVIDAQGPVMGQHDVYRLRELSGESHDESHDNIKLCIVYRQGYTILGFPKFNILLFLNINFAERNYSPVKSCPVH